MVIKASTSAEVRHLIEALGAQDDVAREAAAARLAIIGARAVDRLIAAYDGCDATGVRVAILRVLEASGDARALPLATRALAEGGEAGVAAAALLRALLDARDGRTAAQALDGLVSAALDPSRERRVRLAAFEGLRDVPGGACERVAQALAVDPDNALRVHVTTPPQDPAAVDRVWQDALGGALPGNPDDLRQALKARAAAAPLGHLQALIDVIRAHEGSLAVPGGRAGWLAVRGAIHQSLALRGSLVAMYDLRETIGDATGPLPVSFLAAVHAIGDETCLEPLAAAYARAADSPWRIQLADAFRAVASRHRVGSRSAAMKKIAARWPAVSALVGGSRTRKQPPVR